MNKQPSVIDILEIQEVLDEVKSTTLIGMHPYATTPYMPHRTLSNAILAPNLQTALSFTSATIQQSAVYLEAQEKQNKTKTILLAIYWVWVFVFIGGFYTGFTFLYVSFPFVLRFVFAKIGMLFFFGILAIKEYKEMDQATVNAVKQLWATQKLKLFFSLVAYTLNSICYVLPSKYTTVAQNILFASCSSICIVIWKILKREPQHCFAIVGTIIGMSGSSLTILEQNASSQDQTFTASSMLFGNSLALMGSAFAAAFSIYTADFMKQQFPVAAYSVIAQIACLIFGIPLSLMLEYSEYANIN